MGRAGARGGALYAPTPVEEITRERTAQKLLEIDWDYPVIGDRESDEKLLAAGGHTFAKSSTSALPREEALRYVIRDDPRPLLVMRECEWCEGSDDALLSTRLDNERTILFASWFHMVKLTNHVLENEHPFRNLFEGDSPPHLFLAMPDGSDPVPLSGQQSQTELWRAMTSVLERSYEGDPEKCVKKLYRLLDTFDELDRKENQLLLRFDDELERKGPKSSKLKKIQKDLDEVAKARDEAQATFDELLELGHRATG